MKQLKTREELAKAINLGKYPVLKIDIQNNFKIGDKIVGFGGCKVKTNERIFNGTKLWDKCTIWWYDDEQKFVLNEKNVCVSNRYTYYDLMEDIEFANAPTIDKKQDVVMVVYDSKTQKIFSTMVVSLDKSKQEKIDLMALINL